MNVEQSEKSDHSELKAALNGLTYQSESDYPLDFICWEKSNNGIVDCSFVCANLGQNGVQATEADPQQFFETCTKIEPWFGEEEKESAAGFQNLQHLLNQKYKNLKLFRIGEIEVIIVLLAEDDRNIVGFKTTSIET